MSKHTRKRTATHITYTLSRRQIYWLALCFIIISGAVVGVGVGQGLDPRVSHAFWWLTVIQWSLLVAQIVLLELLIQMGRQARRQASLIRFADAETGEAFTAVGEQMEV